MTKKIESLDDLAYDERNANRGTERGRSTIRNSMEKRGTGRSVVVDANGKIIAGKNATQVAKELGKKARIIQTTGDELIVHQRLDLDLDRDDAAKLLAIDDNRAGQLGLDWDPDILAEDADDGLDLEDAGWEEEELDDILRGAREVEFEDAEGGAAGEGSQRKPRPTVKVAMQCADLTLFEEAMAATGKIQRGEALLEICRVYLDKDPEDDL